jgi:hypothetical protein
LFWVVGPALIDEIDPDRPIGSERDGIHVECALAFWSATGMQIVETIVQRTNDGRRANEAVG